MLDDKPKHPYHILRKDDYKSSVEQKGQFDYLSWAICWDKLKQIDPDARYELVTIIDTFRRAVAKAISMATGYGLDLWINEDIRDLDYIPNSINGKMPVKGGITPDQRVKLDRLSRSNHLKPNGKERILEIMNNPNTTEETANQYIAEIQAAIKKRKSETK